jgi:hypothetical protein
MASDRALKLFIVAAVLGIAWYAANESSPGMVIPVAIVGLATAFWRPVLGIPMAVASAAAAVYVPGVAIAAAAIVGLLALISVWVKSALRHGTVLGNSMSPGDGSLYLGFSGGDLDGGDCDGGV